MCNEEIEMVEPSDYELASLPSASKKYIEALEAENHRLKSELSKETIRKEASYRAEERLLKELSESNRFWFRRFHDDECWIYQEGEENWLESLVCPVVIKPTTLIDILKRAGENQKDHLTENGGLQTP